MEYQTNLPRNIFFTVAIKCLKLSNQGVINVIAFTCIWQHFLSSSFWCAWVCVCVCVCVYVCVCVCVCMCVCVVCTRGKVIPRDYMIQHNFFTSISILRQNYTTHTDYPQHSCIGRVSTFNFFTPLLIAVDFYIFLGILGRLNNFVCFFEQWCVVEKEGLEWKKNIHPSDQKGIT